jgi:hypothetical protein
MMGPVIPAGPILLYPTAIEPRPSLVQAAEQLDGPLALRDVGDHVGEADAVGIDDERRRAARRVAGGAAQQVGHLLHLLARQLRLGLGNVDHLGVARHVGLDELPRVRSNLLGADVSACHEAMSMCSGMPTVCRATGSAATRPVGLRLRY